MDPVTAKLMSAAGAAADLVYVDDVFSTFLYDGDGTTSQTITNGIDLSGEGGMVWIKNRDYEHHNLFDTNRGTGLALESSNNRDQRAPGNTLTAFNSNGFTVSNNNTVGANGEKYCAWTFRKKPGFFDVATYTGNGTAGRQIAHNLGSVPGMIVIKSLATTENWTVWHRSLTSNQYVIQLDTNSAEIQAGNGAWNNTAPTSSVFTLGGDFNVNQNNQNYVAYIFAHQPNTSFVEEVYVQDYYANGSNITGPNGSGEYRFFYNSSLNNTYATVGPNSYSVSGANKWDELSDVIFAALGQRYRVGNLQSSGTVKFYSMEYFTGYTGSTYDDEEVYSVCGGYRGNATSSNEIVLGFEPQWVLIKQRSGTKDWMIFDNMRGIVGGGNDTLLEANNQDAEFTKSLMALTPTGFKLTSSDGDVNGSDDQYIYIAIRRPNKPPEAATEVFTPDLASSSGDYTTTAAFPIDLNFYGGRTGSDKWFLRTRLTGSPYVQPNEIYAIGGALSANSWDSMTDFKLPGISGDYSNYINFNFKRAPGFFDVVTYAGTGSARDIDHNLTVKPELAIIKSTSANGSWIVGSTAFSSGGHLVLDENGGMNNVGSTTRLVYANWSSTVLGIGADSDVNSSGTDYVALLFASLDGICKVGTYSGTGSSINVDCGFTNGARFVMIKRTDSSDNWVVWDTVRGINSGNDPYLRLNLSSAEVTTNDFIDPLGSGFTVGTGSFSVNASGGTYLFFAIA